MNTLQYHNPAAAPEGMIVYPELALGQLWSALQDAQPDVTQTRQVLAEICDRLLGHVLANTSFAVLSDETVPVFILRGGLFFLSAFWKLGSNSSYGLILPYRDTFGSVPTVLCADLPTIQRGIYVVMDLIVNTGATVCECLRIVDPLASAPSAKDVRVHVVAPFMTRLAVEAIRTLFPKVIIHTFWNDMAIGEDGRLVGLRFDGGDCACGGGTRMRYPA